MSFIDDVVIYVKSGNGGNGCVSFYKDKYVSNGKPNGGNGGDGGNIFICCNNKLNSLYSFSCKKCYFASNGSNGEKNNRSGKKGSDIFLYLPFGTKIYNCNGYEYITEVNSVNFFFTLIKGGKGGRGNSKIRKFFNFDLLKGKIGEGLHIKLLLCLYSDVGLIGMPNAGKSTLISYLTYSKSVVSHYPFTTLYPHLGILNLSSNIKVIVSDMPGIIYGASDGFGLGLKFLNHIKNAKLLLHIVDAAFEDEFLIIKNIELLESEILKFDSLILKKQYWILLNKCDRLSYLSLLKIKSFVEKNKKNTQVFSISSITGFGIKNLCNKILDFVINL